MKTFSTLILATLAVAAFATESADAVQVHAHRGQPVMKKVNLAKHQRPAKLVASDLNEGEGNNNGDVLSDPFAEGPIGGVMGFDDEEPPAATKGPLFTESNAGSGTDEGGSLEDGSNEDGSAEDGSAENGSAEDGSAEDGSAEDGSADNEDGSGVTDSKTNPPASKGLDESVEVTEWALFDLESSAVGEEGSGGSQDADEESSSSGSNEDAEGSGSNDGSGPDETTPEGPIGNTQGFDDEDPQPPSGGWGDVTGAGETKEARKAKLHHEQKAAMELAARASADSSAAPFGLKGAKPVLLAGAAVGAAVGALAAVMGVMHLRRQQQRDEQSTLAAELPEPQTGREDFEAAAANAEPVADELASSSVDLEEALTRESESEEEDAEEGAFANGSTVV